MVRILGDDPEASEDAAMSPGRRWTVPGQSMAGRSPSNARSRSLNKVCSGCFLMELQPCRESRPEIHSAWSIRLFCEESVIDEVCHSFQ